MSTATLPAKPGAPRRRRRRALRVVLVVLLVLVVLAVVAYFVGERIFRQQAEQQIATSVEDGFPQGVSGSVTATIDGGSALLQYLRGSFDDVTITSRDLRVAGAAATADVHVHGLPVKGGAVRSATARLTVGEAAFRRLPALQQVDATAPKLGRGVVSTTLTQRFLGVAITIAVQLKPSLSGQIVKLTPSAATITAGPATVPATAIVQQLLPGGVSVCAQQYLPQGITLTSVAARPGEAVVGLAAHDVNLETLDGGTKGTCR